ncbi:DUF5696 domain-containing protein [Paenibacillus sp.]|uniref:DUF5696 domain-containing protein n=1 Tax=Paenibacillus sp. TaxID=58172 RepID=UPI002D6A9362|nr:DUF5696 domain-containing protein [Paenibacillus sp.]HZG85875.1 DUF5696 domain-containing protein [Paenibacillus sp.]
MTWMKRLRLLNPRVAIVAVLVAAAAYIASTAKIEWRTEETATANAAPAASAPAAARDETAGLPADGDFRPVAENETLRLKVHEATGHFIVEDKRNGNVYRSYPDPDYWEREQVSKVWKHHLSSPLMLQYVDFSKPILQPKETSLSAEGGAVSGMREIPGGIEMTFELPELGFSIPVRVKIEQDYVETTVVRDGIGERDLGLIWVRLYPFFGAEYTEEDPNGYLFIPDGPGALIRFKDNKLNVNKIYDERVYGRDMTFPGLINNRNPVGMPVFGMRSGGKGFLAVLHDGEEYANIVASPAGVFSNYNWIASQTNFRASFLQFARRNDPVEWGFISYNEDELFGSDRVTRYYLLDSGSTDYVGMASRYRQYLMDEKGLKRFSPEHSDIPLYVSIIGGDRERGTLSDVYIKGTSTSEAERIVGSMHAGGIRNMTVTYAGWQEGGVSSFGATFPVDSRIGGYDGMKRFVDYAHRLGYRVYLDTVYGINNTGANGFREEFHAMVNLAGHTIGEEGLSVVSDKFAEQLIKADLDAYKKLGVDGLAVNRIGGHLFSDYNTKYGSGRDEARDVQERILRTIQEELGGVIGRSSNFYALPHIDVVQGMASDYSYDLFTDEAVPFAQIATHGLVSYTFRYANNREENVNDFLREIEYGAAPSYVFTAAETKEFINSYNTVFYSTNYEDWGSRVTQEYARFNEALGDVQDQFIVGHRTLADKVKETVYANGKKIIVNYNTEPYADGDIQVPAQDFIIIPGGAGQ